MPLFNGDSNTRQYSFGSVPTGHAHKMNSFESDKYKKTVTIFLEIDLKFKLMFSEHVSSVGRTT